MHTHTRSIHIERVRDGAVTYNINQVFCEINILETVSRVGSKLTLAIDDKTVVRFSTRSAHQTMTKIKLNTHTLRHTHTHTRTLASKTRARTHTRVSESGAFTYMISEVRRRAGQLFVVRFGISIPLVDH